MVLFGVCLLDGYCVDFLLVFWYGSLVSYFLLVVLFMWVGVALVRCGGGLFKVDACLCFCSYGCLAVCWLRVMVVVMVACLLIVLFSFRSFYMCFV